MNPRGYAVCEAAVAAGLSRSAMYRLIAAKQITFSRPPGGDIRVPEAEIDALLSRSRFQARRRGGRTNGKTAALPSAGLAARALREVEAER